MVYNIRTVTPTDQIAGVITVDEAKLHLQEHGTDYDALIEQLVLAAQDHVERITGQVLTPRDMELALQGFPTCDGGLIEIPREPVTEVTLVSYSDSDGVAAELQAADWRWSESEPTLVLPAYATEWPTAYDERGSVRVSFVAGYEEGLAPASLVAAVKLMLGHLYANREAVVTGTIATEVPAGVTALCAAYRRMAI